MKRQPQEPGLSQAATMRYGALMFSCGMGYFAAFIAHEPALPVLVMVIGSTLCVWLGIAVWSWLLTHLRWHRITGNAGVVGLMIGQNGISVGLHRRHVWIWRRRSTPEQEAQ